MGRASSISESMRHIKELPRIRGKIICLSYGQEPRQQRRVSESDVTKGKIRSQPTSNAGVSARCSGSVFIPCHPK